LPDDSNPFLNLANRQAYGGEFNETEYQRRQRDAGVTDPRPRPTPQELIAESRRSYPPAQMNPVREQIIRDRQMRYLGIVPRNQDLRTTVEGYSVLRDPRDPSRWVNLEELQNRVHPAEERRARRGPYVTAVNYGNNGRRPQPLPAPVEYDLPDDSVEAPTNDRKPPDPRLAVIKMGPQRRGFHCPYCYSKFSPQVGSPQQRTRDHVWPSSRFPRIADRFLVYCCRKCNGDKANHTVYEWLEILRSASDPRVKVVVRFINLLAPWLRSSQQ
jgi:hypothetical protein